MIQLILGLFWPEVCPFCGKVNASGPCPGCISDLKTLKIKGPGCFCCGKPVKSPEQEFCLDCRRTKKSFEQGRSLWIHRDPVKKSIYLLKYHNLRSSGYFFAYLMAGRYKKQIEDWNPDLIMPIPLHPGRKRKRGYNQALLVADALGEILDIPVDAHSLARRGLTSPQKKLDHGSRRENLRKAFLLRESFRPVRSVLLIDDIYTTGSTLDTAAFLLKKRGVGQVYFLTVSIGAGDS